MKGQKSIIRTLTNRSFKANKTRNLIAVFAIVLTTVMFTSLFVLSQSMVENMRNMNFQQAGYNSHLSSNTMTDADMEKIVAHEAVRDYGKSTIIGVAENEELTGRQVEIRYADENYARSSFSYPTTGTMPVQENEIALDTITLDKLGLPYELGQEITFEWRKDLTSDEYTTSTFVLSGYWDGNSAAMASMAWVSEAFVQIQCAGIDQEAQLANGQVFGTVMLHLDLYSDSDLEGVAEQILADTGLSNVSLSPNAAYDATMNQNIIREVLPMAICMILVFASGYLIIYNIFQISVASDIRFYGRLKTLGTTKKQLKKMIYGQANRLSLIGIPIGLVIGYLLGAVLVPVMITGTTEEAKAAVNPYIFIGSAVFAYLTVLISCMKPAKIAGKVSPMEALRYTEQLCAQVAALPEGRRGKRILWLHTLPHWQDSLRALLNFRPDVEIVGCDMALDADVLPEPERPYESMARRLVCSSFNGGAERRAERAAELARLLRADGAVYFCHWGCKQTSGAAQLVKRRLEAAGFPTLVLDGDGCDSGNVNDGQMVTRLQAFLELLEGCR